MKQSPYLLYTAVALVIILFAAVVWLLTADVRGGGGGPRADLRRGTCPGLDLRYGYDPAVFAPAPYDGNAEFPLRLDGEGFSLYGKRIRGAGLLLEREPQSQLYDFVGTEDAEVFEKYYGLKRTFEKYEDATIGGSLALHSRQDYELAPQSSNWPRYFPEVVKTGDIAHLEGWAFFTDEDLFYFYSVSAGPLTELQRTACVEVLNSLEFKALMGAAEPDTSVERGAEAVPENTGEDSEPAAGAGS